MIFKNAKVYFGAAVVTSLYMRNRSKSEYIDTNIMKIGLHLARYIREWSRRLLWNTTLETLLTPI
jgi:hypothetical protein